MPTPAPIGLVQRVHSILDARLSATAPAPIALGLSGGSDSLALMLVCQAWAKTRGRKLLALTVDHGLQAASAEWAAFCRARAMARGIEHRTLVWTPPQLSGGLPAAARAARHALLAEASRAAGAHVLLMGHTADDLAESAAMRAAGSTVPDARLWSPSPAWPQGRDLFLLRPLLGERRQALRDWLVQAGEGWIEDPANADLRFARARARANVSELPAPDQGDEAAGPATRTALPAAGPLEAAGGLRIPATAGERVLGRALLCAAGGTRPPRRDRLEMAMARLAAGESIVLAGARAWREGDQVLVCREPGELRRSKASDLVLCRGGTAVWDGRFELEPPMDWSGAPLRVRALAGSTSRLPDGEQMALKSLPAAARGALPLVTDDATLWTCPILAVSPFVGVRALARNRLEAALGHLVHERDVANAAGLPISRVNRPSV
jgi:tRNA(Ile)-lysidine synthase